MTHEDLDDWFKQQFIERLGARRVEIGMLGALIEAVDDYRGAVLTTMVAEANQKEAKNGDKNHDDGMD